MISGRRAAVLVAMLTAGCGVTLRVERPSPTMTRGALSITAAQAARCERSPPARGRTYRAPLPGAVTDPALLPYLDSLPPDVRRTAVAAGIEPLVARVLRDHQRRAITPEHLALRQELDERIASLQPQLLAVEFECECNIELLQRRLDDYEEGEHSRQLAVAIASVVTGAAIEIGAAIWDLANQHTDMPAAPDGPLVTELVGGVVTTALASLALAPFPREIVISHEHNLLEPIERGTDPDLLYPTFVLRLLTLPMPSGEPSPRDELLAR